MMKKMIFALLCLVSTAASAQIVPDFWTTYMRVWRGGSFDEYGVSGEMPVRNASTIEIEGKTYDLAFVDSITFCKPVLIDYSQNTAEVIIPPQVYGVTATVNGADVVINNTNTDEELRFLLMGDSNNGSFTYNGSYKTTITLGILHLTSNTKAAIDIQCGKRIKMEVCEAHLADGAGGKQKAALYCKGHLELSGIDGVGGSLSVTGNTGHAIATKEYLQIKKSMGYVDVYGSVKDGIHAGQYLQVNGGDIHIQNNKGDAIQVEALLDKDGNIDATEENNGQLIVKGGVITASATQDDTHVLKVDGDINISGGIFNLTATGAGSRCIDANANLNISQDNANTTMTLSASGEKYDDGTGDTSRSRLGKVDGDMTLSAGTVKCTITKPAKGFKIDGTFYKLGGTITGTKDGASASATDLVEAAGGVKTTK